MSYESISVKEAINKLNAPVNGWFLPAVQRPYVWGSRYENEMYICKLFDSILRGYPIGGLIIWNTEDEIPYREFITNYRENEIPGIVDIGLHGRKDKWLVYDGQQRLQTLFSCLRHSFNEKILVFDLLHEKNNEIDRDETGFSFVPKNSQLPWSSVRLNELYAKQPDEGKKYERELLRKANIVLDDEQEEIVCANLAKIWKVFVETDKKSLSYFPILNSEESEVNEIFERLNSGGIALSLSDLLFSKIKEKHPFFEEQLQNASKSIYGKSGKGYTFSAYNILQLIFLLVKGQVRVDPKKIKTNELDSFAQTWSKLEAPLEGFFSDFIWGQFKINNAAIIPRKLSLLPLIVYFYEVYNKGYNFKHISDGNIRLLKQYFIKSQVNDWNLQSYVDNFSSLIRMESELHGGKIFDFPLAKIENKINEQKKRQIDILEETFTGYIWFSLKILTPTRSYEFEPDGNGRFNPEIDHIYPTNLKGQDDAYKRINHTIWNMQPVNGDVNNHKSNYHPVLFFTDQAKDSKGNSINGSMYTLHYDFLEPLLSKKSYEITSPSKDVIEFISARRKLMIQCLSEYYGITLIVKEDPTF